MGWQDAPEVSAAPAWASAPEVDQSSLGDKIMKQAGNLAAGAVRGAGSIGATLLRPVNRWNPDGTKVDGAAVDAQRRGEMDAALQAMGADPSSLAFKGGKLVGEVAGTMGAGGALANTLARIPGVASAAPGVVEAIRTGGMSAGAAGGPAASAAARILGGAVTGGASAGLVNPEDAGVGALIGGALPGATWVAGKAGDKIGQILRGPAQGADTAQAVGAARTAGYVIPPTQANPTLVNRLLEGVSGKITTAQNASAKNQAVTGRLAAEALGLPGDTKLTADVLKSVRSSAGQAFESLRNTGTVQADQTYDQALNAIVAKYKGAAGGFPGLEKPEVESLITTLRQPVFSSGSAVDAVRVLREKADAAFGAGDKGLGKAIKEAAAAIEDQLERHLATTGQPAAVLDDFRAARQLIAKTYSVEKALNPTTGAVDARKLATQLTKGQPLTGELKTAAEFAARFPKAAQTVEGMGSLPQTSPLDWHASGALSLATGNPLGLLLAGVRPAARATVLSPAVQNSLIQRPSALAQLLAGQGAQQALYRSAPVAISSGGQ